MLCFVWIILFYILIDRVASQVPPRLAPLPRELEFRRGERFQLVCSCREGEPPLTFSWLRDGAALVETQEVSVRRFDEFSSSLTISALREDSAANYTCIVSNQGGSDSSTVKLTVLVSPTWLRQPYDMSVLSGARVSLNCEASGVPRPNVTWRRSRGFNLQQMESLSSSHWRTGEDGSLTTSGVRKEDEGFYSCEVDNGVGEGLRKTVRLEVQVPPSVSVSETERTVVKGEPTTLRCDVTGDVPLTISWGKANRNLPLISEDRIKLQEETGPENSTSQVLILSTAAEDTGLYLCTARNTYGQSQATLRLSVVERPSVPLDFRASEVWCKSVRLRWRQPYNGNSPLKHYVIRYKRKDSTSPPTETKVPASQSWCVIGDLQPRTPYIFQVLAVNEVGVSGASSQLQATTQEEEPEAAPTNVHVKSKDSSGFLLSWKPPPPDKWNGDLTAFSIGYKRVSHGSTQFLPFTYNVLNLDDNSTPLNPLDPLEYRVRGLQESSSYTVVVRAVNRAGFGPSSEPVLVKTSYGESPQVPTVTLVSTEQTVITLQVEQKGKKKAPPTQYTLHIREGVGHWLKIPLSPSLQTEYRVGGLVAGAPYKLYVTAKNHYGDSGPSEVVTFRTEPEIRGGGRGASFLPASLFHHTRGRVHDPSPRRAHLRMLLPSETEQPRQAATHRRRRIPWLHVHRLGRVSPSPAEVPSPSTFLFRWSSGQQQQPFFRSLLDASELRVRDSRQRSPIQPVHGRQQARTTIHGRRPPANKARKLLRRTRNLKSGQTSSTASL